MSSDNERYDIVATSSLTDIGTRVLKFGDAFAVFNRYGDIHQVGNGEQGLYFGGTRFLSQLDLTVASERLLLLSSAVRGNNLMLAVDLAAPELRLGDGTEIIPHASLHMFRAKFLHDGVCYERIKVTNYSAKTIDVEVALDFAADYADVFEVRGMRRPERGKKHPTQVGRGDVTLSYHGLDDIKRLTRLIFSPFPTKLTEQRASYTLFLEPRQSRNIYVTAACEIREGPARIMPSFDQAYEQACARVGEYDQSDCEITSSSGQFNEWVNRSLADIRLMTTETPQGRYPYAGIPWFSTAFGRDGIITAMELLWVAPELARGVLQFLAFRQAEEEDRPSDAEPGKILHETRSGEMANTREVPFGLYYGSVDSTPLFVMLAGAYVESTNDLQALSLLWPHVERALGWIDRYGDADGDGFVEYCKRASDGLVQQGWKDSHDSVFHSDGTLAQAPIALCEVQGYVYAAKRMAAMMAERLGHTAKARALLEQAGDLQERFDQAFWCDDLSTFALALDGRKRPCRVRTSNAGHCLFTRIAKPERAIPMANLLLSRDMFSGWGVRTLAEQETRYNPMSYHNGSVWPHDNAMIAQGLAQYGFKQQALRVLMGMFEASQFLDLHRLPELFCGFKRRPGEGPTQYPVACAPQAWAAAAPFLLLKAALGLSIDAQNGRITLDHPVLPSFLQKLSIKGLRVGAASVDLTLHRYADDVGVSVDRRMGEVAVVSVR